jgi:hypothetical protein
MLVLVATAPDTIVTAPNTIVTVQHSIAPGLTWTQH